MRKMALLLLLSLAVAVPAGAGPKITTVYGTNNIAVDTDNLRAAIDGAPKNGTVELVGTFQLDGSIIYIERGYITIEGRAVDNDGDGAVNEDWADGADNDGDGAIDEDDWDAQLNGLLDGAGEPVDDVVAPDFALFNRGLTVQGTTEDLNQITIRNIKFFGLNRGVGFLPEVLVPDGLRCADVVLTGGTISNAVVEGNWFDNVDRSFQIFGNSSNVAVRNNLITNWVRANAMPLVSGGAFCFDAAGNPSSFPLGTPVGTHLTGNRWDGGTRGALGVFGATDTQVRGNAFRNAPNAIDIEGARNQAQHNTIDNVNNGVFVAGPSEGSLIANNSITNAGFAGVFFTLGGGGTALNNTFSNVGYVDYFMDVDSVGNKVRLRKGQTYEDNGTDNDIR